MTLRLAPARAREMPPHGLGPVRGADRRRVRACTARVVSPDRRVRARLVSWSYAFAGGAGALLTGGGVAGFAFFGFFAFLRFVSPMVGFV